jgi:phospholipid/cholesterol/gamma-HCH transport system permease protein
MNVFTHIGRYCLLLRNVFGRPEKARIYWNQFLTETRSLGLNSFGIVALISVFMGAVITLQTASMIGNPWVPLYTVGYTTRQSVILEFSPTIISLILAGKVGSNIASEIGTMRVTEQIDALDIMGVNSAGYLIFPKILAAVFFFPFLVIFSMALGLIGGWLVVLGTGVMTEPGYLYGIKFDFQTFSVTYALIKTVCFAFIITTISAYQGYYTDGGALEVGRSSTRAVVHSSILILIMNYILTNLLLI